MFRVVIPARFASSRLPGKPLEMIGGKPMIQRVHERAVQSGAAEVIIATDDDRIAAVAHGFGADARLTSPDHASGTDRIAEVATAAGWGDHDIVVNLQGDEPFMRPQLLDQVAALAARHPSAGIATLATPIDSLESLHEPNVVKVIADSAERALDFSRAPLDGALRHIGLYAYRVSALKRLARLPPTPRERAERLEQLRALENGIEIRVAVAIAKSGPHVDTPEDLARARDIAEDITA